MTFEVLTSIPPRGARDLNVTFDPLAEGQVRTSAALPTVRFEFDKALRNIAIAGLNGLNNGLEPRPRGSGNFFQFWIADCLYGGNRINGGYFHRVIRTLLHDYVVGQHGANLVFKLERTMCKRCIKRTKDAVFVKVDPQRLPKDLTNINISQDFGSLPFSGR